MQPLNNWNVYNVTNYGNNVIYFKKNKNTESSFKKEILHKKLFKFHQYFSQYMNSLNTRQKLNLFYLTLFVSLLTLVSLLKHDLYCLKSVK